MFMYRNRRKFFTIFLVVQLLVIICIPGSGFGADEPEKIPVKVLILPKFEIGEITDDFPGEAQLYYKEYLTGGEEYELRGYPENEVLYYKDGVALLVTGQGKVNAALSTSTVLSDERFDFSDAYVLSVGCGGAAHGYGILGDVFVISASVDYDLGHHADPRELTVPSDTTWFHDSSFDETAAVMMDPELVKAVYGMVKDTALKTTDRTKRYLKESFPGEEWADRAPRVMLGTSVTSDNFWKGIYDHQNAVLIAETYGCPDPYAVTEMEDIAVAQTLRVFHMLDRLICLRAGVNMDVFTPGMTPETLWDENVSDTVASEDGLESVDIFVTAMENNFLVGKTVIDFILEADEGIK